MNEFGPYRVLNKKHPHGFTKKNEDFSFKKQQLVRIYSLQLDEQLLCDFLIYQQLAHDHYTRNLAAWSSMGNYKEVDIPEVLLDTKPVFPKIETNRVVYVISNQVLPQIMEIDNKKEQIEMFGLKNTLKTKRLGKIMDKRKAAIERYFEKAMAAHRTFIETNLDYGLVNLK